MDQPRQSPGRHALVGALVGLVLFLFNFDNAQTPAHEIGKLIGSVGPAAGIGYAIGLWRNRVRSKNDYW